MKKALKVARWEIKKTLTNKTFLISVLVTPLIFLAFAIIPTLLASVESTRTYNINVIDEIGIFEQLNQSINHNLFTLTKINQSYETFREEIKEQNRQALIVFNQTNLENENIIIYYGGDVLPNINQLNYPIQKTLREHFLSNITLEQNTKERIIEGYLLQSNALIQEEKEDIFEKLIPGLFAAFILLGVFITGTMIFQSAIQEKKNKVSEILLSSISSEDLMSGKILGFFIVGLFQIAVWFLFITIILIFTSNLHLLTYLLTPKLLLLLFFAFGGYLLYASLFVSMGATIDDISTSGNFQSIIVMIPLFPIFFISAIITDPNGLIAQIGSFLPFTTPGVMLFRLSISNNVPISEIIIAVIILIVSVYLMMKLAGKIFKIGILKFGKNATFKEIFKWVISK